MSDRQQQKEKQQQQQRRGRDGERNNGREEEELSRGGANKGGSDVRGAVVPSQSLDDFAAECARSETGTGSERVQAPGRKEGGL
ncbi:unnamed protein product [Lampetra fluviatilis]